MLSNIASLNCTQSFCGNAAFVGVLRADIVLRETRKQQLYLNSEIQQKMH